MRCIRSARGQSTAEYAVLFAIVIGAAIAMQQYVKGRLQNAVKFQADKYETAAGIKGVFEDPNRSTHSKSGVNLTMKSATAGDIKIDSSSNTTQNKK